MHFNNFRDVITFVDTIKEKLIAGERWPYPTVETNSPNSEGGKVRTHYLFGGLPTFVITDWRSDWLLLKNLLGKENHWFLEVEAQEMISGLGENPGSAWISDPDRWKKHIMPNGRFHYTYGERLGGQPHALVQRIKDDPLTRQAFMSVWSDTDITHAGVERVPCTIGYYYHFDGTTIRFTQLMRSLEISYCLSNDMYLSARLFAWILIKAGIDPEIKTELTIASMQAHLMEAK